MCVPVSSSDRSKSIAAVERGKYLCKGRSKAPVIDVTQVLLKVRMDDYLPRSQTSRDCVHVPIWPVDRDGLHVRQRETRFFIPFGMTCNKIAHGWPDNSIYP